jgi:hypothetical protein
MAYLVGFGVIEATVVYPFLAALYAGDDRELGMVFGTFNVQ